MGFRMTMPPSTMPTASATAAAPGRILPPIIQGGMGAGIPVQIPGVTVHAPAD
jgi:hypothetical protein